MERCRKGKGFWDQYWSGTFGIIVLVFCLLYTTPSATAQPWSAAQQTHLRTQLEQFLFALEGRPQNGCTRFDTPDASTLAMRHQKYFQALASLRPQLQDTGTDPYARARAQALLGTLAWDAEYGQEAEQAFRTALQLVAQGGGWRVRQAGEATAPGAGYAWRLARVLDEASSGLFSEASRLYQQAVAWYEVNAPADEERIEALLDWSYPAHGGTIAERIARIDKALALARTLGRAQLRALAVQAWGRLLLCVLEREDEPAALEVLPRAETALAALRPGDLNEQTRTFVMIRVAETLARDQQWERFAKQLEALRRQQTAVLDRGATAGMPADNAFEGANAIEIHRLELLWRVATTSLGPEGQLRLPLAEQLRLFALADFLKSDAVTLGLMSGLWERQQLASQSARKPPPHAISRDGCLTDLGPDWGEFSQEKLGPSELARAEMAERLGVNTDGPMSRGMAVVLANALAADEMYLQLTVLPGWVVIGRVLCDKFGMRAIKVDTQNLRTTLRHWREALRTERPVNNAPKIRAIGQQLLHLGFKHIFELIPARVQHILVASDEVLTGAPLGALPWLDEHGRDTMPQRWLAQRWSFIITGNATSLFVPRQLVAPTTSQQPFTLFAIGHSGKGWINGAEPPLANTPEQRQAARIRKAARSLLQLQSYRSEIDQLVKVVGRRAHIMLDKAATLDVLQHDKWTNATILVIAAHALSPQGLLLEPIDTSVLLLEPGREPTAGLLTPTALLHSRRLTADLVILSSCNTMATSVHTRSRLYAMLPSAFLAQGARAVLTSGWQVGDAPTAEFVPDFIARWQRDTGSGLAAAYASAQRAAITAGRPVRDWATWMLFGDPLR